MRLGKAPSSVIVRVVADQLSICASNTRNADVKDCKKSAAPLRQENAKACEMVGSEAGSPA